MYRAYPPRRLFAVGVRHSVRAEIARSEAIKTQQIREMYREETLHPQDRIPTRPTQAVADTPAIRANLANRRIA